MQLNELDCLQTAGNTGVGSCFADISKIIGAILAPKGYELDITSLQANLVAGTHNANKANRLFPIYDFKTITDSTEKPVIQSFPDGSRAFVRDGFNDWMFQFIQGGVSLLKQLRKFNKTAYDFYFIDDNGKILGITGSSNTMLRAFPSDGGFFQALPWKPNDGSKVTEYMIQFVFNSKYTADDIAFAVADFDLPSTVFGLQDITLSGVAEIDPVGATCTDTIVIGSTNDTINIKFVGLSSNVSITGGAITQTSSETTATLLAAKIVTAINANTLTNGGFSATNALGVITVTGSTSNGAQLNGLTLSSVIVGAITATPTAFAGGVTGGTPGSYDITALTDATASNLYDLFSDELADAGMWLATNKETGLPVAITAVTAGSLTAKTFIVAVNKSDANYPTSGQHISINLAAPAVLQADGVDGYESDGPVSIAKN